jgi:hypothetical protein
MRSTTTSRRRLTLAGLVLLIAGLTAGCEASGEESDAIGPDATADAPADAPPVDVPPDDVPADAPPADVPPEDVPADVPPADVPPEDVPLEDAPHELIDETCPAPTPYPEQCEAVSDFQCGFTAACVDGVIQATWHIHHFCSPNDALEDIIEYACEASCALGCIGGDYYEWPQNGQQLVADLCAECTPEGAGDCTGPHDDCDGAWACLGGRCAWQCTVPCVPEGGSAAVIPNAPECCAGLGKVPCDAPDLNGACQSCDGASVCVACGDGQCGLGENPCNCPADCTNEPPDLCALAGGACVETCNEGGMAEYVVDNAGCKEGALCCVPQYEACLGLGGGFLDFDTEGKCCEGLVASNDCGLMDDGACSCPKCPCYLCLPCGDGECGPFEHACNCPADCGAQAMLLPATQSECQGAPAPAASQPVADDGAGIATLTVEGSALFLKHEGLKMNCCAVVEVWGTIDEAHHALRLDELHQQPYNPCFCECFFTVTAELSGVPSGTWTVTITNEEYDYDLLVQELTIP